MLWEPGEEWELPALDVECVDECDPDEPRANTPGLAQASTAANASTANRMNAPSCGLSGNHALPAATDALRQVKAGQNERLEATARNRREKG